MTTRKTSKARVNDKEGKKTPVYHINFRVDSPYTREAFHVAAKLAKGAKASSLLSMYVHRIINEARDKNPQEFEKRLAARLQKLEDGEKIETSKNVVMARAVDSPAELKDVKKAS